MAAPARAGALAVRIFLMAIVACFITLLHHGHIVMFLTDVRAQLRGRKEMDGARIRQEPSKLEIDFGDPDTHYIVAVHRKQRSLEVGLHFEGERDENERRLQMLADRGDMLRSRLGASIEMEHWGRGWTRVHDTTVLSSEDWSPKRDLTQAMVLDTARRVLRFVRVLQPLVKRLARGCDHARY
jgi:hypothetical protein